MFAGLSFDGGWILTDRNREIELKFLVDGVQAEAILAYLLPSASLASRHLRSIYFDTPDRALRGAGYSLRVRGDGSLSTQTVKSDWKGKGAGRDEWEAEVSGETPDLRLPGNTPVGSVLGERVPERLFEVDADRRVFMVGSGGAVIEVSLDYREAKIGEHISAFGELELELKSGPVGALFELATSLRASFSLRPSFVTKADRGFALVDPVAKSGRHFAPPTLSETMSAGEAFTAIGLAALRQIAANAEELKVRPAGETIHQMRMAIRRLRSTIDIFEPVAASARGKGLVAELKWISAKLDAARDLEVFLAGPLVRKNSPTRGTSKSAILHGRLLLDRRRAYEAARAAAKSDRLSAILLDGLALIELGPLTVDPNDANGRDRSIVDFAAVALDHARLNVRGRTRGFDQLSSAKRHKLRIAAKTLRYAADVFDGLFPEKATRAAAFLKAIKALLDRLGELNDLVGAKKIVAGHPSPGSLDARIAKHEPRLISAAHRALKDFDDAKRFWPKPHARGQKP